MNFRICRPMQTATTTIHYWAALNHFSMYAGDIDVVVCNDIDVVNCMCESVFCDKTAILLASLLKGTLKTFVIS